MIASLADAWAWYESAKNFALSMRQLARHWDGLDWEGDLGRENRLRALEAPEIVERSNLLIDNLDDFCVLLLFSVFEAIVRDRVLEDISAEGAPRHPAVQYAIKALKESIEHGSFFRVLEPYKRIDADLIEQVNQVRKFRNWVAHGRRGNPENAVDPELAYDRLQRFLDQLNALPVGTTPGPVPA
jgi:hypothetical protein